MHYLGEQIVTMYGKLLARIMHALKLFAATLAESGRFTLLQRVAPGTAADAVVRVLGGVFRHADAEGRPLLHALEDIIDTVGVVLRHSTLPGKDMLFTVIRPFNCGLLSSVFLTFLSSPPAWR
jgi:hypothetical protein